MIHARRQRRGFIYAFALCTTAICSAIALAALLAVRISKRAAVADADFSEARIYARAGIEIGMHFISTDPFWRTNKGNNPWATNFPVGRGKFSLSAMDPVDNDVRVGENHPVILTSTGCKGEAVCKMSVRMEVGPKTRSCLEVSLCSNDDCSIGGATLTSTQTISSNHNVGAGGGSIVNANVEAVNQISGSTYTQSKKLITNPRYLPDPLHVFDTYVAAGTLIPYTSLPQSLQPELITNTDFETGVTGWYVYSGATATKLTWDAGNYAGGLYSMKVTGRKFVPDVAAQDVPLASIKKGHDYTLKMSVCLNGTGTIQASLTLLNSVGTSFTYSTPAVTVLTAGTWYNLQGIIVPTWSGTLTKATVLLTTDSIKSYNMDKVSMKDTTFRSGSYYIEGRLLSPTVNPFGATNANGIYVLNCGGKDVIVLNSRIVGTLVVQTPGGNTAIQGAVNWEPAVANYPALLTDDKISIELDAAVLNESDLQVNFNPTGCPYPYAGGTANTTSIDSYPSQIAGIIYSAKDLKFSGESTVLGNITADGKAEVSATSLDLTYSNVFYNNPPPGFDVGRVPMFPVPGTWQRTAQ